jgi:hypothetical protein
VTYEIPLLVTAIVFAAFLVFKFRPVVGHEGRASAALLDDAKKRIAAAKDDDARALALADAAEASIRLGRSSSGVNLFLRAFRTAPASKALVERAAAALARRPSALEKLMWRHLALGAGEGTTRLPATRVALQTLAVVYARRPPTRVRQQGIEHLLALVDAASHR